MRRILQYKYPIIFFAVLSALSYAGYVWYLNSAEPAAAIRTFTVERSDMEAQVSATGTISPVNKVDVSSKVTGLILEMRAEENDIVTEGDVLVVLDDSAIKAQVAQAQARLDNARVDYARKSRLASIGAISLSDLDLAEMDYKVAQASYDTVSADLADTTILAPLTGMVIGKPIPAGQTVAQGISNPMVILTIADMSKMQIETKVDESDIGTVEEGQRTVFTVDAYPGKNFSGVVSLISRQAITDQNVIYYRVMIDIDNPEGLFPNMTARVSIITGKSENTLNVPLVAVRETNGVKTVQLINKDGQSELVTVTTGLFTDDRIEILSGLKEGDEIALSQRQPPRQRSGMMMMGGGRR